MNPRIKITDNSLIVLESDSYDQKTYVPQKFDLNFSDLGETVVEGDLFPRYVKREAITIEQAKTLGFKGFIIKCQFERDRILV